MDEREMRQNDEVEINLLQLARAMMDRAWQIILVSVLCASLVLGYTFYFITPQYQSSAMLYINNNGGDASQKISNADLVTSRGLVDSYLVILKTRETMNAVIDYAGVDLTYKQAGKMVSAEAVNSTEIFRITVTNPDPQVAAKLANAVAHVLPDQITSVMGGTSAKIVENAVVSTDPSSPSYTKNTIIGFMLGFLLSAGIIVLKEIFDKTIRTEEDIEEVCAHPILTLVPDMMPGGMKTPRKYNAGSAKNSKKKKGKAASAKVQKQNEILIGNNISFAATEAYKRLRTKLQFSFADENGCRVIGLTSALSGEGKSLNATNLAYTLAQLRKRVILLDCDMRRPTQAEKMGLNKKPGLSEYLTGQYEFVDVVQCYGKEKEEVIFHVVTAGENPPNPVEMLNSGRMERILMSLRKAYDYVILDLPPVTEVTDALSIAPKLDGMLLVVRQNYCDRVVLKDTVRQLAFIKTKVLGIVFNGANEHGGKYLGKGYYKPYQEANKKA